MVKPEEKPQPEKKPEPEEKPSPADHKDDKNENEQYNSPVLTPEQQSGIIELEVEEKNDY